jgi:hypothetical protein
MIAPRLTERIGAPATIAVRAVVSALGCLALHDNGGIAGVWLDAGSPLLPAD